MKTYIALPASSRPLTHDQRTLGHWFAALLSSGRGPRKITKLDHALRDVGMRGVSYETLCKASRCVVVLPAKYVAHLATVYDLSGEETAAFSQVALLAHASPEVVALHRRAHRLPVNLPVPDLHRADPIAAAG